MADHAELSTPDLPPDPVATEIALCDWIEQQALHDLFAAASPEHRANAELFVLRAPGVLAFGAPGVPSLMLNRVFLEPGPDACERDELLRALERYTRRGVPHYFVHVSPHAAPRLEGALRSAGLVRYRRDWVKLLRDARPVPELHVPFDVGLCRLDEAEAFAELEVSAFGLSPQVARLLPALVQRPGWHVYVARSGPSLVAAGALFVKGDVGYLGFAATARTHRGLGLQRALIARRLRLARALGCRAIASETGVALPGEPNSSQANLMSLGLRPIATRLNYVPPGTTWR